MNISNTEHLREYLDTLIENVCIINCTGTMKDANIYSVNTTPLKLLGEWTSLRYNRSLIHMSTSQVFLPGTYDNSRVNMETYPGTLYGESKRRAELNLINNGSNYSIIRFSDLFGGIGKISDLVESIVDKLYEDSPTVTIIDKYTRPTYNFNLAVSISQLAIDRLMGNVKEADILHSNYDHDVSLYYSELAEEICKIVEIPKPIEVEPPLAQVQGVELIGNWLIGSRYSLGLRAAVLEYCYKRGYKERPKKKGRF